jgi:uncharacterized protein (DUF2062 family)
VTFDCIRCSLASFETFALFCFSLDIVKSRDYHFTVVQTARQYKDLLTRFSTLSALVPLRFLSVRALALTLALALALALPLALALALALALPLALELVLALALTMALDLALTFVSDIFFRLGLGGFFFSSCSIN